MSEREDDFDRAYTQNEPSAWKVSTGHDTIFWFLFGDEPRPGRPDLPPYPCWMRIPGPVSTESRWDHQTWRIAVLGAAGEPSWFDEPLRIGERFWVGTSRFDANDQWLASRIADIVRSEFNAVPVPYSVCRRCGRRLREHLDLCEPACLGVTQ